MNIIIDQGNTSAKVAFYDRQKISGSFIFKPLQVEKLRKLLNEFSPSRGIFCSVSGADPEIIFLLKERLEAFVLLDAATPLPIRVAYRTPDTLGKDRLAAVVGAYKKFPDRNILVIDAGTAITYDLLKAGGEYLGGNISPGMTTRFKALNAFTKQLPLLDEQGDIPDIGYDTQTAIRTGVIHGILHEIDSTITSFRDKYPDLLVFLTGGHSFYFETKLKNSIFADGNLVLDGLNEILNYQYA